jgi:mercuric ion binding protein
MRIFKSPIAWCLGTLLAMGSAARAETKVELKNVHLCCGACVKAVATTLKDIEGVKAACDQKGRMVTLTAKDDATAQKAIDALAAAGFQGESDNKDLKAKDDSGASAGKVKTLTLTGVHNCCGQCCKAIKATVAKVNGVTGDTAKPKMDTFEVTGDFDAADLVKALNDAGFHVKVKK